MVTRIWAFFHEYDPLDMCLLYHQLPCLQSEDLFREFRSFSFCISQISLLMFGITSFICTGVCLNYKPPQAGPTVYIPSLRVALRRIGMVVKCNRFVKINKRSMYIYLYLPSHKREVMPQCFIAYMLFHWRNKYPFFLLEHLELHLSNPHGLWQWRLWTMD